MENAARPTPLNAYVSGVEFRVLGPVEALHDGARLALGGPKQKAVLALLVATARRPVSVDALIGGVYGDDASPGSRRTIHTYVSNLRGQVGDIIRRSGDGYVLECDNIDSREFEELYRKGVDTLAEDPGSSAIQLRSALALWRGHAYGDVEGRSALDGEITRLEELRLAALDARIEADLALGMHRDLIGELEALVAEYPLRESFRGHQMVALYRSGRQSEALRAYGRMRQTLVEELGIDPSPDLQDLETAILTQDPKLEVRIRAMVERRAILAVELDDSIAHATAADRDAALSRRDALLSLEASEAGGELVDVRGAAAYAAFPSVGTALTVALQLMGEPLRMAVDHGDVEVGDDGVTGPPVIRALRLAAVGHPQQVLVSAEAQSTLATSTESGWTMRSLGRHVIRGLDGDRQVFQLVGGRGPVEFPDLLLDRLPPPLPLPTSSAAVAGYELREEIGGGAVGAVHRAYQASVGREVAIRSVRPELVADPRFIRRFESEAQRVAAVDHPHLVPLLDYWRDPGAAFMVSRLMRGGDLRSRIGFHAFDATETMAIVERIGSAVAAAHAAGLVHGRVRPENVMFDENDNPYLADLGLAAIFGGLVQFPAGAHTAPEAIGSPATVASDIYSLGVMVSELVSGAATPLDRPLSLADPELERVLSRATASDVASRPGSIEDFIDELGRVLTRNGAAVSFRQAVRNPYKGLTAFRESDAADFFGREELVASLVAAVGSQPLTLVVGPSGIGKSSVVRAGLIPAVRSTPGFESWVVTDMFPGPRPFDELEAAIERVALSSPSGRIDALRSGTASLSDLVDHCLPEGSVLMLVVDQFEELFTHVIDEESRRRFLSMVSDAGPNVRVVATMRADFYDRPLGYSNFGGVASRSTVAVHAPTAADLEQVIRAPAASVGVMVSDALVESLIADCENEPGALPLLQHVLTELFDERDVDLIEIGDYRAAGGMAGSIGRRAEHLFLGFGPEERRLARQVFLRMVTVDEESEDTRRRVRRSELERIPGPEGGLDRVLDAFGRHRLVVFDRDAATRGPTVEVAHEALLRHWDRLRGWVDEVRDDLLMRRRVEVATRDWVDSGADASYLLSGGRLERAESWREASGIDVSDEEQAFLAECRRVVDADRARRRRLRRRVVTALSGALALAVALGSFGWVQRGVAEREAITARMQELATQAEVAIDEDPDLAILLALEAYDLSEQLDLDRTPGEVMRALHVTTQASRLVRRIEGSYVLATAVSEGLFAATLTEPSNVVEIRELRSGGLVTTIEAEGPVAAIDANPDGSMLAIGYGDPYGGVLELEDVPAGALFDVATGEHVADVPHECCTWAIEFSPDGTMVLSVVNDVPEGLSHVWRPSTDDEWLVEQGWGTWMSDSASLAAIDFVTPSVRLVRVESGAVSDVIDTGDFLADSISVSPDGSRLSLTSRTNSEVQVWAFGSIVPERALPGPGVLAAPFLPKGDRILVLGNTTVHQLVDLSSAEAVSLFGHTGGVWTAALYDGYVVIPTPDDLFVWDTSDAGPGLLGAFASETEIVNVGPIDESDRLAITTTNGPGVADVRRVDLDTGAIDQRSRPFGWDTWRWPVVSNDGRYGGLISDDPDRGVIVELDTLEETLLGRCETVKAIDGTRGLAVVDRTTACKTPGTPAVIDFIDDEEVFRLPSGELPSAAFGIPGTPSENSLVVAWFDRIEVYSVDTWELTGVFEGNGVDFLFPFFSADGRWLTPSNMAGVAHILDFASGAVTDGEVALTQSFDGGPSPAQVIRASQSYAVTAHSGREIKIWDRRQGDLWFSIPTNAKNGNALILAADETVLWYEDGSSVLKRLPFRSVDLADLARARLNRDFTVDECERFLSDADCSVYGEDP